MQTRHGAGTAFTVKGPQIGLKSLIGAGSTVYLEDRVSPTSSYDGEVALTNYQSTTVRMAFE